MGKLSLKGFTLEAAHKFCQVLNHSEKKTNKQKAKTTERNEELSTVKGEGTASKSVGLSDP